MDQHIQGRKAEEVAELPFMLKLDLQHFADDVTEVETPQDVNAEDDENITWEQFDSDKPKETQEQAEQLAVADPEPEKPKQDHETNKAFQEMRKAKEAAEKQASEADQWAKDTYGHLGISTFKEYQQALADQRKREDYQEKGIDYDEVRKIAKEEAETHPEVIRARQQIQEAAVKAEIAELTSAHPDVKIGSVEDIYALPNHEEIIKRINRGYSLKDAYEIVNRDTIEQKRLAAAEQSARNKMNSKSHLKSPSNGDAGEIFVVPDDVMHQYRAIFAKQIKAGKMTEADFVKHYKKSQGK